MLASHFFFSKKADEIIQGPVSRKTEIAWSPELVYIIGSNDVAPTYTASATILSLR